MTKRPFGIRASFFIRASTFVILSSLVLRQSLDIPQRGRCSTMSFSLAELQQVIRNTYDAKDRRRGVAGTFMWFMEEVGELAAALQSGTPTEQAAEFADVLAWLA